MQYKTLITAACLMAAIASPVAAADPRSPQKREWPPAYAAEPLRYNWSGFYAGVHAGGAFDKYTGT
ncbi:hypothetical protein, partial [Streptomyces sp. NPDC020681]|uniref:hypothetical protein n=1 Tax=Streptomyces sp. NPDC020681 TaxID=3365083 RepID=UPI00379A3FD4